MAGYTYKVKRGKRRPRRNRRKAAKKPFYKSSSFWSKAAHLGLTGVKALLGLNTESKWLDTTSTGTTSTTLTAMQYELLVPEGTTANSRTGDGFRLTHYRTRIALQCGVASTGTYVVRVICVYQPIVNNNVIAASEILQSTTNYISPYNMDTEGYKILADKLFYISPAGVEGDHATFEFDYSPENHMVKWSTSDTTGASANLERGNIRCFIMTNATGTPPDYSMYSRIHFVDN